ncbi:hypothetical protein BHE74_00023498 [Ensete ventricosum]|nr:hypothetical protein GW17_00046285 [Ensete ventricosum]RWW68942.1 hypothetical protein BHE74_00023498 [Ensete ventricosum]
MYFSVNNLLCVHFIWMEYSGWKTWTMLHTCSTAAQWCEDRLIGVRQTNGSH